MSWTALWRRLRQQFGVLFTIGAALSFANLVSALQFVIDAWAFVLSLVDDAPMLEQLARILGAIVGALLEWWRAVLRVPLAWLGLSLPNWVIDAGSAISFVIGRGFTRWLDLRAKVADAHYDSRAKRTISGAAEFGLVVEGDCDATSPEFKARARREADISRVEYKKRRRQLPFDVAITVLALAAFFAALYAMDAWYRSL